MTSQASPSAPGQPGPETAEKLDPDDALAKAMSELRSVAQSDSDPSDGIATAVAPPLPSTNGSLSHTLREIPLQVQAVIGRANMSVAQLNGLKSGATVPLDSRVGDPVDIIINGVKVATGQMQLSEDDPDRFAFKVISVCS